MSVIVLDTETTGVGKVDEIIQLAFSDLLFEDIFADESVIIDQIIANGINKKFRPSVPIHPEAAKVNGAKYVDLLKCPPSKPLDDVGLDADYIIGHNIAFDKRMMLQCVAEDRANIFDNTKFICTMDLAKKLDKNLDIGFANHKLDTIISHFYADNELVKSALLTPTHDALGDIIKTILALKKLLEYIPAVTSFEELYIFQQQLKAVKKR